VAAVQTLPGGTTIYWCPMPGCDWQHAETPSEVSRLALAEVFGVGVFAATTEVQRLERIESLLRGHLGSHKLAEWVKALTEANGEIERLKAAQDVQPVSAP
jgi:hypothetical protein